MLDRAQRLVYIGKAKDLQARLNSYRFRSLEGMEAAVQAIEWLPLSSEDEALTMENRLIRDFQPRFNRIGKERSEGVGIAFRTIQARAFEFALVGREEPDPSVWYSVGRFRKPGRASRLLASIIRWTWLAVRGRFDMPELLLRAGAPRGITRIEVLISGPAQAEVDHALKRYLAGHEALPEIDIERVECGPSGRLSAIEDDRLLLNRAIAFELSHLREMREGVSKSTLEPLSAGPLLSLALQDDVRSIRAADLRRASKSWAKRKPSTPSRSE